ncbi:hypothetical protein Ga0100231_008465 [Opitutaceae bacterium TAV4]|uniref:glycosyl hydrolase 115 family protein n=1 Tax=Geminisphaera colitermitum TaxID=1148786 RepID=UPI000158CFD2|nr:glycosyl hydrolase 115 family protein [Geminisphaera colitermitum]RRJ94387.1 hypothetical protein Ga0100231_008465 [Opitutaceae bacterium TAV4]RRJ98477.1 hypothetical protein Ga0100230_008745 [Opitutaceae bacterium TAV3]
MVSATPPIPRPAISRSPRTTSQTDGPLDIEPNAASRLPGVAAALADLQRDLKKILYPETECNNDAPFIHLEILLVPDSMPRETFTLEISPSLPSPRHTCANDGNIHIHLNASDELGAIYGIYEFSHRFLDVDPLWFWKDIEPAPLAPTTQAAIAELLRRLSTQRIETPPPAFRHRGWFINDEDLLSHWQPPSGERFRDWPGRDRTFAISLEDEDNCYETRLLHYYTPVATAETMEMVFEALLRLRGNLIIPASFIDIMNEPEAAIIHAAIRRGLYVSQHHAEPLGVSHFAYETWCSKNNYTTAPFSYREAPAAMRACWRAYATRWHTVAGDHIIWQLGLRGRGDRPLWSHDPEAQARAGEFIEAALADQLAIIREVDPRLPPPPATLTLWLEGSDLVASKRLRIPESITCVFADHCETQELQADFRHFPRTPAHTRGCYYHVAVWPCGPHLAQGPRPSKIARIIASLVERGDTYYAIVNVSNLREHVLGAQTFLEQTWQPDPIPLTDAAHLARWLPGSLLPLHTALLDCLPEVSPGFTLYDGAARRFIYDRLFALTPCNARRARPIPVGPDGMDAFRQRLATSIERLRDLCNTLDAQSSIHAKGTRWHSFFETNLRAQAGILLGLYRSLDALLTPSPDFTTATDGLDAAMRSFRIGEAGRWHAWYRGDTKMALRNLCERIIRIQKTIQK